MAGEKTKSKPRTTPKPESAKQEEYISMTKDQFQSLVSESIKAAMGQAQSVPSSAKKEIETNMQSALTTRINERNSKGKRFDEYLSDPNGPRVRIVIDRIYREFTGSEVTATVNGNTVKVPVDGKPHLVHPAHYAAIKEKLNYLSETRDRAADSNELFGDEAGDYQKVENT